MKVSRHEVERELRTICASPIFTRAHRMREMLEDFVQCALEGRLGDLKGAVIGVRLFGRSPGYDTTADPIVRVNAGNLRDRLTEYYETVGRSDPVTITVPTGGYVPVFSYNRNLAPRLSDTAAQHVWNAKAGMNRRTPESYELAFKYLELALREYPDHPRLLALQALAHLNRAMFCGVNSRAELELAERILSALRLDENAPWEAWVADACIKQSLHWKWDASQSSYDEAIRLSQGEAKYYQGWYTQFLASQRRFAEGIAILRNAIEDFAYDLPVIRSDLAILQVMGGEFEDAEKTLRTTLTLFPHEPNLAYIDLAIMREAQDKPDEAVALLEKVPADSPEGHIVLGLRYAYLGFAGRLDEARRGFEELKAMRETGFAPASQIAMAALGCGEKDAAVQWITVAALVERDPICIWFNVMPFTRRLHAHPGFRELIENTMQLPLH
jgi:Tfp pilus assembly protein PilF